MATKFKVLSLFDGISGAAQALKELGIECEYYASEIDKWAIEISRKNHPEIIQLGDVKDIDNWNLVLNGFAGTTNGKQNKLDLLIGGSPCQDLSIAKRDGKGHNMDGGKKPEEGYYDNAEIHFEEESRADEYGYVAKMAYQFTKQILG